MAPSSKATDGRRKSGSKPSLIVSLSVPSPKLREVIEPDSVKPESSSSPAQDAEDVKQSPDSAAVQPTSPSNANGDNTDSKAATPQAEGTPAPGAMGPPADGPKKKGVKRSAANANGTIDGVPKQKGKPGPKKKPRL